MNIDYDRGVQKHRYEGVDVYMYLDDPGVYLNAFGSEVGEPLAKSAGFDTDKLGKLHRRKEMMAKAKAGIEAELLIIDEAPLKVVKTVNGFGLVDMGLGRYQVQDPDGTYLIRDPVSRELADKLLLALAGPYKEEAEPGDKKLASKPASK